MVVGVDDADEVLTRTKVSLLAVVLSHTAVNQSHDVLDRALFGSRIAGHKVIAVCGSPAKSDLDGVVQFLEGGVVRADQSAPNLRVSGVRDGDLEDPRGLFLGLARVLVGGPVLSLTSGACGSVSLTFGRRGHFEDAYRSTCDCHSGHR